MRTLRDLQRRDVERRRSTPPDFRSLPQRPQPAPGSDHPAGGVGRGHNPGIVPGAGASGAGAAAPRGAGRPAAEPKPGRGNDKEKGKDKDKK